jgi:hypothetical protein
MAKCAVCGKPATHQVTINENGKFERVPLCDEHYAEVMGGASSPMESLFRDVGAAARGPPPVAALRAPARDAARANPWTCSRS